MTVAIKKFFT